MLLKLLFGQNQEHEKKKAEWGLLDDLRLRIEHARANGLNYIPCKASEFVKILSVPEMARSAENPSSPGYLYWYFEGFRIEVVAED